MHIYISIYQFIYIAFDTLSSGPAVSLCESWKIEESQAAQKRSGALFL